MRLATRFRSAFPAAFLIASLATPALAQRATYPAEEFTARREKLIATLPPGVAVMMFAASMPQPGIRFRQDNDFFYLTGNEDLSAILYIDTTRRESFLFLPKQPPRQIEVDGPNWLEDKDAAKTRGFAAIHPLPYLEEFLARRRNAAPQTLYVRLSERDEVDMSRGDKALHWGRKASSSWGTQPTEDAWRIDELRRRYPHFELKDISPTMDALRVIKTPREIEILRRNGKISAEGIKRAIALTKAGRYEYELEAEARYVFAKGGSEMDAYPAIVGSGPNVNTWHYNRNDRALENGDLIVMDYGASLGYQTMDITRTWPVSGKFDELQERAYRADLEAQKAIIAAMRPGATRAQTQEICRKIFEKWGFGDQRPGSAGHFVGLAVHDVGDPNEPFKPGMVIAVEPIIEIKDKRIHIRIEDTVLITEGEPEILSKDVPKEVDELLALISKAAPPARPVSR
jgi:Xaa-Pro aminopeptidase